ncbi:MAG: hypothetical protein R6X13_00825 [bacterium]
MNQTAPRFALLALFLPAVLAAQVSFTRTYGGAADDFGHTAVATGDGYLLAGYTYSYGSGAGDAHLVRTDATGETLWTRVFGSDADDLSFRAVATADGGCAVVGFAIRSGRADVTLLKTDARGDSSWCRTYGGNSDDLGYAVDQCPDSGFIIAGATFSYGSGRPNIYAIRTDAQGDTLWTRTYGGSSEEYAFSVAATADSGFIVCGWTKSFGAGAGDIYLIKLDDAGDTLWTRMYGGAGNDYGHAIRQTPDGGYIVAGSTFSYGAGESDFWLVRTDARGDTLWTRTYGGATSDLGHSVDLAADGGFALAGQTNSFGAGSYDAWLVRTDARGDTLWTRAFGGDAEERAYSVAATVDGGFTLGGWTRSSGAGGADAWLVKTDSLGRVGIAEPQPPQTRAIGRARARCASPAVGTLPGRPGAVVFDAVGRRVTGRLSPGVYVAAGTGSTMLVVVR